MTVALEEPRFALNAKQRLAASSSADEILYGGAAYGGKSYLIRLLHIEACYRVPGLQSYIFRRTYDDLLQNHVFGPGGFPEMLEPFGGLATINYSDHRIHWYNGSVIHLRHMQRDTDRYKYQGAEIQLLSFDELTHFPSSVYRYLRGRVRLGSLEVPDDYPLPLPRIVNGTNPGGLGHNWVRETWIDPAPPFKVWTAPDDDGGMQRQFIPAILDDNPAADTADYEKRLAGLGNPALTKAYRHGDWNIVAGGAFDDVWSEAAHVLPVQPIEARHTIERSFDYGSSAPFSVGWHARLLEPVTLRRFDGESRTYPRGSVIRVAEWYGWNGKANEGCRFSTSAIAAGILSREKEMKLGMVAAGSADRSIFDVADGDSIADKLARAGVRFRPGAKGPGSRKAGLEVLRSMLEAARAVPRIEYPAYVVFDVCRHFVRTVPVLPRSERDPEDVDTLAEDHVYDEVRYALTTPSRHSTIHTRQH